MKTRILCALALTFAVLTDVYAYGPPGHKMVGEIADKLLAGKAVADSIHTLLDGLTLAEAALLPDEIKGWDKTPPGDPEAFHLAARPDIENQVHFAGRDGGERNGAGA